MLDCGRFMCVFFLFTFNASDLLLALPRAIIHCVPSFSSSSITALRVLRTSLKLMKLFRYSKFYLMTPMSFNDSSIPWRVSISTKAFVPIMPDFSIKFDRYLIITLINLVKKLFNPWFQFLGQLHLSNYPLSLKV
jgi:hypothetical protein